MARKRANKIQAELADAITNSQELPLLVWSKRGYENTLKNIQSENHYIGTITGELKKKIMMNDEELVWTDWTTKATLETEIELKEVNLNLLLAIYSFIILNEDKIKGREISVYAVDLARFLGIDIYGKNRFNLAQNLNQFENLFCIDGNTIYRVLALLEYDTEKQIIVISVPYLFHLLEKIKIENDSKLFMKLLKSQSVKKSKYANEVAQALLILVIQRDTGKSGIQTAHKKVSNIIATCPMLAYKLKKYELSGRIDHYNKLLTNAFKNAEKIIQDSKYSNVDDYYSMFNIIAFRDVNNELKTKKENVEEIVKIEFVRKEKIK